MTTPREQLAKAVERAGHVADRGLIAAFLRDAGTEFTVNPFPSTSAATVGHVWGSQAFEFRVLGVKAAGLPCLLTAVSQLERGDPLVQAILRSGPHTLNIFHHPGGHRIVGAVLYGKPGVPLPSFTIVKRRPRRARPRVNSAQLDLFAWASRSRVIINIKSKFSGIIQDG